MKKFYNHLRFLSLPAFILVPCDGIGHPLAGGQSMMLSNQGMGMELGKMIGKKVKVVGTLEEAKGVNTLTATEFEEIKKRSADRTDAIGRDGGLAPTILPYHRCNQLFFQPVLSIPLVGGTGCFFSGIDAVPPE